MKRIKNKSSTIALFQEGAVAESTDMVGTMFRKQIVKFGKWVDPFYPNEYMELNKEWGKQIVANFNKGIPGPVPVPLDHTDQTEANTGEVIKLEMDDEGIYAYMDIRRPATVEDIHNGLIFDVSISYDNNYADTKDGKLHGPVLLHVALVNSPYLKGMSSFEQVESADFSEAIGRVAHALALPQSNSVIMLSEAKVKELEKMPKSKKVQLSTVKNDKEFDVEITVKNDEGEDVAKTLKAGEETEVPEDQAEAVLTQIADAKDPEESDDDASDDDDDKDKGGNADVGGDDDGKGDLSEKERAELAELRKGARISLAKEQYAELLKAGKITPAQEPAFMALAEVTQPVQLSAKKQVSIVEAVASVLEAGPQIVKFSEDGSAKGDDGDDESDDDKNKTPFEKLSEAEQRGLEATGVTAEQFNKNAENPEFVAALNSIDSKANKENE